jgi:hypothetical protein
VDLAWSAMMLSVLVLLVVVSSMVNAERMVELSHSL